MITKQTFCVILINDNKSTSNCIMVNICFSQLPYSNRYTNLEYFLIYSSVDSNRTFRCNLELQRSYLQMNKVIQTRGRLGISPQGASPCFAKVFCVCQRCLQYAICDNIPQYDSHPPLVSKHSPDTWANTPRYSLLQCLQMKTISVVCIAFI